MPRSSCAASPASTSPSSSASPPTTCAAAEASGRGLAVSVPMACQLIGRWRIVAADLRDGGYLDLCGPAMPGSGFVCASARSQARCAEPGRCRGLGVGEKLRGDVDAENPAGGADRLGERERRRTRPAADVEHRLPRHRRRLGEQQVGYAGLYGVEVVGTGTQTRPGSTFQWSAWSAFAAIALPSRSGVRAPTIAADPSPKKPLGSRAAALHTRGHGDRRKLTGAEAGVVSHPRKDRGPKVSMRRSRSPGLGRGGGRTLLVEFVRDGLRLTGTTSGATPPSAAPASCTSTASR